MVELSTEQKTVYDGILTWFKKHEDPGYKGGRRYLTIGGYAGTGKTTIIHEFCRNERGLRIHACALTGRAALNIGSKLSGTLVRVSTIHKLIYEPIIDENGKLIGWNDVDLSKSGIDLIIVDEASMVSSKIFSDLLNTNIPILFVGDHGQLPPINKNDGVTLNPLPDHELVKNHLGPSGFNLMSNPELRLETIHRQALDSPIIQLSMRARTGKHIAMGRYSEGVMKIKNVGLVEHLLKEDADQVILTDLNRRRVKLNQAHLKYKKLMPHHQILKGNTYPVPVVGSRLVCLRNNFRIPIPIYNGALGVLNDIKDYDEHRYKAGIKLDDGGMYNGLISKHTFLSEKARVPDEVDYRRQGDLFDYGYCLTVHKAQGSEFDRVFIFGSGWGEFRNQWLYTAITRAKKELYICMDKI